MMIRKDNPSPPHCPNPPDTACPPGGQTTISPPSKVKNDRLRPFTVLASGIDTLVLAIDVNWKDESFFQYLAEMKEKAIAEDKEIGIEIRNDLGSIFWKGTIKPHGSKGYEWIITGTDFSLIIGNWGKPRSKPSIMAQVSSEGLWRLGPVVAVDFLVELINCSGGKIVSNKISRVDLCIDITFPAKIWSPNLANYCVSRATHTATHFNNRKLTGLSIGKKKISARLYDKPLEIKQKSKKFWMFNIWGIRSVPDSLKVIRIEFQLRREVIKDLGLDQVDSLFSHCDNLWAYCSKEWLKFQSRPGKHHTQRKTFRW